MARMPKPPAFWGPNLDGIDPGEALQNADKTNQEGSPENREAMPQELPQGILSGLQPPRQFWTVESSPLNLLFEKHEAREMLQSAYGNEGGSSPAEDPRIKSLLKPGVPYPRGQAAGLLGCMVGSYPGVITKITSTHDGHPPLDPHTQYQGADVATQDPKAAMEAGAACGAVFQVDEYAHPSPKSTGPHVHLQTRPGRGGARGPYFPKPRP